MSFQKLYERQLNTTQSILSSRFFNAASKGSLRLASYFYKKKSFENLTLSFSFSVLTPLSAHHFQLCCCP